MVGRNYFTAFIEGLVVDGLLQATTAATNSYSADTFKLSFAASKRNPISYWASLSTGYLELFCAIGEAAKTVPLITGMIDNIVIDPLRGITSIEGRDLSASLVDTYRQQDFVNQTASEIVETLAGNHGLVPYVTPTSEIVGRCYSRDYTKLSLGQYSKIRSDWDLAVQLARENSYDLFVSGNGLYFQPQGIDSDILSISPNDVFNIQIERSLRVGPDASIRMQSWDTESMTVNVGSAATGSPDGQAYLFTGANLTGSQVDQKAMQYLSEVQRLRTVLSISMQIETSLDPRAVIQLFGTDSTLDGSYRVDSVARRYNTMTGSIQSVSASAL